VIGEIAVRSRFLSPGYWGSPDLTARAFSVDVGGGAERTYRTGDLGRMRADGCLEHLGRKDFRVKIRGQTVEVADVEGALLELPSIDHAVVVARDRALGDARLVAYLVPSVSPNLAGRRGPAHRPEPSNGSVTGSGAPVRPTASELRRHLAARLPNSMIPASYVWIDALPLNENRKVDRRALPPPVRSRPELQTEYRAPQDALQDQIARIWEDLLEVSPVGIHDDFMELGGDSLLAIRMLTEVERSCGFATESPALLEAATVERLSAALLARQSGAPEPVVAVQPGGTRPPLFFLHGDYVTGGLFCLGLARELGPDQPFFALTPCGVGGESVPATVQAMADRHLKALRSVQPKGPYRLVGNCNGGLMALEMARRLVAEGEEVPVLAMIRTSAANARYQRLASAVHKLGVLLRLGPESEARLLAHLRWYFDAMRQASPSERAAITVEKLGKAIVAATRRGRQKSLENRTNGLPESPADRRARLADAYMRLAAEYVPARYCGHATVFWPGEDDEPPDEAERAWRQVVGRLDFQSVPGTHLSYVTRHVGEFAHRLQACLQAEAGSVR